MKANSFVQTFLKWLLCLICLCFILYILPATGVCRKTQEVDVNSGLIRQRTTFLTIHFGEKTNKTIVSQYASKHGDSSDWREVSSVVVWPDWLPHIKVFTDPRYGGVFTQMGELQTLWSARTFSEVEKGEEADVLLKNWRESDSSRSGGLYISELWKNKVAMTGRTNEFH